MKSNLQKVEQEVDEAREEKVQALTAVGQQQEQLKCQLKQVESDLDQARLDCSNLKESLVSAQSSFVEKEEKMIQEREAANEEIGKGKKEICKLQTVIADRESSSSELQEQLEQAQEDAALELEQARSSFVEKEQKLIQEREENDRKVTAGEEEICKLQSVISDMESSSGEVQAEMQEQISTLRKDLEQANDDAGVSSKQWLERETALSNEIDEMQAKVLQIADVSSKQWMEKEVALTEEIQHHKQELEESELKLSTLTKDLDQAKMMPMSPPSSGWRKNSLYQRRFNTTNKNWKKGNSSCLLSPKTWTTPKMMQMHPPSNGKKTK